MQNKITVVMAVIFYSIGNSFGFPIEYKALRCGCDWCADEFCRLKLERTSAQRVASDSLFWKLHVSVAVDVYGVVGIALSEVHPCVVNYCVRVLCIKAYNYIQINAFFFNIYVNSMNL